MSNIIRAIFNNVNDKEVFAKARYQYDYGMILRFEGAVTLPSAYEVHFALEKHGEAITQIGDPEGVPVPDALFLAGKTIYAWAYLHSGEDDGYTEYMVQIPVIKRAQPSDEVPTPVQQSAIDQAIAALGVAVEQTAADVETTTANAESAQASEEAAAASAAEAAETAENVEENVTAARAAKAAAESARDRAVQAETSANQSKTAAASSETNAAASATAASASAAAALTSEENANGAMMSAYSDANRADTAADTATSAKNDAVSAKNAAQSAKTAAETAATTATQKASAAATSADTATTKATAAANSATAAAGSATAAANSATEAATTAQGISDHLDQIDENTDAIEGLKEDLDGMGSSVLDTNIFDLTTAEDGKRIAPDGSVVENAEGYFLSDWIECDPSTTYIKNSLKEDSYHRAAWYNASKSIINVSTNNVFKTTPTSKYIRICGTIAEKTTTWLSKATAKDDIARAGINDLSGSISDVSSTTKNLYNKYANTVGVLKDTGEIDTSEADYFVSDYIDVEGKQFTISWGTNPPDNYLRIGLYNGSKVFQARVLRALSNDEKSYVVDNVNAFRYVRLSCKNGIDKIQIELNSSKTSYEEHFTAKDITARDAVSAVVPNMVFCPVLRNGTTAHPTNAQQVATKEIIPFGNSDSITILINKSVSSVGNYWRVIFDTFTVDTGKPEDNQGNTVKFDQVIDKTKITIYKGFFDTISTGFAFSLAEKTSGGTVIAHRIGDFQAGDIVILRDYAYLGERGKYEYSGDKITLNPMYAFRLIGNMPSTESGKYIQGIATYGNTLVALYDTGYFKMFGIEPFTGTALHSGELEGKSASLHCNSCTFGNFYNVSDPLPLLYVTGGTADAVQGYCEVVRFNSSYEALHLQTISIDYSDFAEFGYIAEHNTPNFYTDGTCLWTFGAKYRTNGSQEAHNNENRFIIHRYELPSTSDVSVVLTASDIMDEFVLPYNAFFMQGGTVHYGKMFSLFGMGGQVQGSYRAINKMLVYNLFGGSEIANVDMTDLITNATEPESLAVHGNDLLINYGDGRLFALTF